MHYSDPQIPQTNRQWFLAHELGSSEGPPDPGTGSGSHTCFHSNTDSLLFSDVLFFHGCLVNFPEPTRCRMTSIINW